MVDPNKDKENQNVPGSVPVTSNPYNMTGSGMTGGFTSPDTVTGVGNTVVDNSGATTPSGDTTANSAATTTTGNTGATVSGAPGTAGAANPAETTAPETTTSTTTNPDQNHTLSYGEFIAQEYEKMHTDTINFYDKQNQDALAAIEAQRQAGEDYANQQKATADAAAAAQRAADEAQANAQYDILSKYSEDEKNAIYAFAEAEKIANIAQAAEIYQMLVDSINKMKEQGTQLTEDQKALLLQLSEEERQNVYATAERQRIEAEKNAEIERERGVVDARSSYEQNLASYGANAEAMGRMGLTGGGYSDYLNSKAYAQQRAETQAANAEASAVKREARYAEDQARLAADANYYKSKYAAEKDYLDRMYEINTSYEENMLKANTDKSTAEHAAESAERAAQHEADSNYLKNLAAAESERSGALHDAETAERDSKLNTDLTYQTNIFENDSQARSDTLSANKESEAGKLGADLTYSENLINQAKEDKANEEAKAEENKKNFTALLDGANSGAYTSEQLERLADEYGLDPEQKQMLINAAEDYQTKSQAATSSGVAEAIGDTVGAINAAVESGTLSREEGDARIATIQNQNFSEYSSEMSYISISDIGNTSAIDAALANKEISQTQYNQLKSEWNRKVASSGFEGDDGTAYSKNTAQKYLDEVLNNPWASLETKEKVKEQYNKLYTPSKVAGAYYGGLGNGKAGNNMTVVTDGNTANSVKYAVQSGGEVTDQHIKDVGSDVGNQQMFAYDGKIYLKYKDGSGTYRYYLIEARPGDKSGYNELREYFGI